MAKATPASPKQVMWVKKMAEQLPLADIMVEGLDGTPVTLESLVKANFTDDMTGKTAGWLLDMLFAASDKATASLVPGIYEHAGQVYLVKVGVKSGKPYAMELTWDFAPDGKTWLLTYQGGVAASLSAGERCPVDVPAGDLKFAKASVIGALYEAWQVSAVLTEAGI
jgi:hypothetical protein